MHVVEASQASNMGDYIGMESCVDLMKPDVGEGCCGGVGGKRDKRWGLRNEKKRKEYPPPIRCLARSENVPTSQLPWVMKRYYTGDGRLIIREEKAPNSEYLLAHRSNGRLTLQLVPMFSDGGCYEFEEKEDQVTENPEPEPAAADRDVKKSVSGGGGGGGGAVKCYNYDETARSSSCLYVMQVPAM